MTQPLSGDPTERIDKVQWLHHRSDAPTPPTGDPLTDEEIAKRFHYAYERLAPQYGYETRSESQTAWTHVPQANRELMIATVKSVRSAIDADLRATIEQLTTERDEWKRNSDDGDEVLDITHDMMVAHTEALKVRVAAAERSNDKALGVVRLAVEKRTLFDTMPDDAGTVEFVDWVRAYSDICVRYDAAIATFDAASPPKPPKPTKEQEMVELFRKRRANTKWGTCDTHDSRGGVHQQYDGCVNWAASPPEKGTDDG